jgi:hypothetical protein
MRASLRLEVLVALRFQKKEKTKNDKDEQEEHEKALEKTRALP